MVVSYSKCCIAKEKEIWTLQVVLLTPTCTIQKRFAIHTQLHYRQPHCECRPLHYRKHAQIVTVYYDRSDVTQVEDRMVEQKSALPQYLESRFQTVPQYLGVFLKPKNSENHVLPQYLECPNN